MQNPFNITFGEIPESIISRENDNKKILNSFLSSNPDTKVYVITGPRGCGKTVMLQTLTNELRNNDFLIIDLNPFLDLEEQFASKVYEAGKLKKLFIHPEFSFSFKGLSFSINGNSEISNITTLIEKMLEYLKKKNQKILITIDDVNPNNNIKSFIYSYQQMIRNNYNVFLLITGLYENVSEISSDKSLTFFLRAPKINLEPLNLLEITYLYKNTLKLDEKDAIKYAKLTKGYAYAYQLIGSLIFKNGISSNIIDEYDLNLMKNSYSLTWERLTKREKEFLTALSETKNQKEICKKLNFSNGNLQTYKRRLLDKGLITQKERGKLDFALPRFSEYVKLEYELNND